MADGSLIFDTSIDSTGFKSGINRLGSIASTGLKVVTGAVVGASTALAGLGVSAIKVGSNFESSMSQVAATMGITVNEIQAGSAEFEILSKAAKNAGETTKFSATESAEALNYLALAGYDAQKAAEALPAVLNLAAAGGLDLAYASDLATDAMSALGIEATTANLTDFGDKMAKAAQKSNTSVAQLGEAILTVGGTAKKLAGGTTELNTALGVLANRGIKGAEGGTALRNVILALSAPTDSASKKMSQLGLSVYDAEGNMRPLNDIFKDLNSSLASLTEQEKTDILNTIFNKVDLKSAEALLAGCGDEFDNLAKAIANSGGAMQDMADTQIDNLKGDIELLKSALEGLGITAYESEFQSSARGVVQAATEMVGKLNAALSEGGLEGFVSEMGGIGADIVTDIAEYTPQLIDAGINVIKAFIMGISDNTDQILDAAVSIGESLFNGIIELLPTLSELGYKMLIAIKDKLVESIPEMIPAAISMLTDFVNYALRNIGPILTIGAEIIKAIIKGIVNAIPVLVASIPGLLSSFAQGFTDLLSVVIQIGNDIINGIVDGIKAAGGSLIQAGKDAVGGMVEGIKNFLGIKSPSRVMKKMFEGDFSDGIVLGVKKGEKKVISAIKAMSAAAVTTAKEFSKDYKEFGENYIDLMCEGIDSKADEFIEKVESIVSTIVDKNKNAKQKYSEAGESVIDAYKDAILNGANEAKEIISTKITEITEDWQEQRDSILKDQEDMRSKLAAYGDELFSYDDNDNMVLKNIEDNIKALERYDKALTDLKNRDGMSDALLSEITEMDVDEGTAFAEKLLSLRDNQFENYVLNWETQQAKAREIAEKFYADELEMLDKKYTDDLDKTLADIPELVKNIGIETIQGLSIGMMSEKDNAVSTAREIAEAVKSELEGAFDINSPSKWAKNVIGKNIPLGVVEGVDEILPQTKSDLEKSLRALTDLKLAVGSTDYSDARTNNILRETAMVKETHTKIIEREKIAGIRLDGRLKDVARVLKPALELEDKVAGGSLVY